MLTIKCYWQKHLSHNFQSRENKNREISKKQCGKHKNVSWSDQNGELTASSRLFYRVKQLRWQGQTTEMTRWKRYFDKKFSREFCVKVPFYVYQNCPILITTYVSILYKKSLRIAKIGPRRVPVQKIACIWAEKCQFLQHLLLSLGHPNFKTGNYIDLNPRYIFYVNVQHKAKIAWDTQIRIF